MYIVVLVLGVFAVAAGSLTVLFGLSIKEFSFGSTLLITGTTMFVGGLVMIAVGGAIRELHRIAQALTRPAPRFPRPGEPFDPYAPGSFRPGMNAPRMPPVPPAPMPPPQGGPEGPARARGPHEPKLDAAVHASPVIFPELTEPASPSLQPQAQTVAEAAVAPLSGPPAEFGEPDAIPLSPEETPRAPAFEMPDLGPQPSTEPESEAQPVAGREPASDTTGVESEPQPPAGRERPSPFDAIWPPRDRAAKPRLAEAGAEDTRAPQETDAPQATATTGAESSITPEVEPGAPWQTADAAAAEGTETATTEAIPYEPQPVSILKSGVVDGMAYTLYSDGSIEAQLPDETIRFASIAELRLHLEKTG